MLGVIVRNARNVTLTQRTKLLQKIKNKNKNKKHILWKTQRDLLF